MPSGGLLEYKKVLGSSLLETGNNSLESRRVDLLFQIYASCKCMLPKCRIDFSGFKQPASGAIMGTSGYYWKMSIFT